MNVNLTKPVNLRKRPTPVSYLHPSRNRVNYVR